MIGYKDVFKQVYDSTKNRLRKGSINIPDLAMNLKNNYSTRSKGSYSDFLVSFSSQYLAMRDFFEENKNSWSKEELNKFESKILELDNFCKK